MLKTINEKLTYSIFFLVISIPFVSITGPFLTDLFLSLSSLLFLIYCLINKESKYFKNIFFIIFILWNLYLIFISLLSEFPLLSLESSLFYFRFGIFSLTIYFLIMTQDKFIKYFTYSLFIVFTFVILNSIFQYFFMYDFFGNQYDGIRLSGIFGEERILGSFLSRLAPLLIGCILLLYKKNIRIVLLSLIILILVDIIIFLSGERAAFFNLIFFSLILIFFTKSFKIIRLSALIISLIFIVFISIQNKSSYDRMILKTIDQTNVLNEKPNAFSIQHEVVYKTALKIYKDNYIFGIGPKNFREFCKEDKYKTFTDQDHSIDGCQSHPHNFYLQLLLESGPLGLLPVLLLFLSIVYYYIRDLYSSLINKRKLLNDNFVIFSSSIVINLWPLIPTGNFFNNYLSFLIYLPVGFIIYIVLENKYLHE